MKNKFKKTKICILIVILTTFVNNVCHAQAALLVLVFGDKVASEKFHLSIDAGLNVSTLPGLNEQKYITGINFGLGTFIKLNDRWALTPEFKPLSPMGAKNVTNILLNDVQLQNSTTDFNFNYIDVPILIRYNISSTLFIAGGPQVSFLTSAKQVTSGTTDSGQSVDITQDMESVMNKQNFMLPIEIGYSLSKKRAGKGIDLKVRYNFSVTDAFATPLASSQNSTLQFILAFPFINTPAESK